MDFNDENTIREKVKEIVPFDRHIKSLIGWIEKRSNNLFDDPKYKDKLEKLLKENKNAKELWDKLLNMEIEITEIFNCEYGAFWKYISKIPEEEREEERKKVCGMIDLGQMNLGMIKYHWTGMMDAEKDSISYNFHYEKLKERIDKLHFYLYGDGVARNEIYNQGARYYFNGNPRPKDSWWTQIHYYLADRLYYQWYDPSYNGG